MTILAAVTLIAIMRLRTDRGGHDAATVGGSHTLVHCAALAPAEFTVAAGGRQEIAAQFSGGSGHLALTWWASGGVLSTTGGRGERREIGARVDIDDFEDGTLDGAIWRWEAQKNIALSEMMTMRVSLAAGSEDVVARLEGKHALEGDFAAQVTVRDVTAHANRGAAALTFVMLDGAEAHVQALSGPGYAALETNARQADGTWRSSASTLYGGGPVNLRIVRVGSTITSSFDRGSGPVPLGTFAELSSAAGHLRLETWSLDQHPAVDAELDNFGVAQNTIVSWRAPDDAIAGSSYTVKLGASCEARARIEKPSAAH